VGLFTWLFKNKDENEITEIVDGKLYSTKNATYLCDFDIDNSSTFSLMSFHYRLYKSNKGQYFATISGHIQLIPVNEAKQILENINEIELYKQEFGLEEG
jgi:hypothetical protein